MTKGITLLFVALVSSAIACADEAGRDATTPENPSDPSGADRPAAPSAPPASVETPPGVVPPNNKLLEWSFEPASADCNGWLVTGAEAIRAAPPRSGSYSCKVCGTGDQTTLSLSRDLGITKAGHYVLSAWVRKRAQNAAPEDAVAQIDATTRAGVTLASAKSTTVAVREEWDRLETSVDLLGAGDSILHITIGSETASADRCLFIDDVTLTRE